MLIQFDAKHLDERKIRTLVKIGDRYGEANMNFSR
jgi:hypothetical protein